MPSAQAFASCCRRGRIGGGGAVAGAVAGYSGVCAGSVAGAGNFAVVVDFSSVSAAFAAGHDVVIWPGGEVDAMRSWSKRHDVVLGGRKGFIRQAIRSGVPIVPVATVGGHDTVFVLSECRKLAKMLRLKKLLRTEIAPLILGFPFGITLEAFPMHIPLPAKIRTEILEPIEIDTDPERENDNGYVDKKYKEVECAIQEGVNRLARLSKKTFFGSLFV